MIKLCAALLSGVVGLNGPTIPIKLETSPLPTSNVACAREYEDLPLSSASRAMPGERSALTIAVVDRYIAAYAREYRATVGATPTLEVRRAKDPAHRRELANQDRLQFMLVMVALDMFDRRYVDFSHPAYAACVRAHIVTEIEKLPAGGTYDLSPAMVINMFKMDGPPVTRMIPW